LASSAVVTLVTEVVLPKLDIAMESGIIIKWHKKEGDSVEKGEPLVEIMSDKVTYDLEVPASGVLRKIIGKEQTEVPVSQIIGYIGKPDEPIPQVEIPAKAQIKPLPQAEVPARVQTREEIRASPSARRIARELAIDLRQVVGTGPGGRIIEEDVKKFSEKGVVRERKVKDTIPLIGVRKTIADRMALSASTAPRITLMVEAGAWEMIKLRSQMKEVEGTDVSFTDILVKAVAIALENDPIINSMLENGQIKVFEDVNVGIAVAGEDALVVPVIRNANKKTLAEIASMSKNLIAKARNGTLSKEEISGGTFTVTNLGTDGIDTFTPLMNPPECAILGVGRIAERPVVANGSIVAKPTVFLSLSFDHRITDGVPAAQFLQRLKELLERPGLK
jgi:pyruvate dehydrogenase E2 component (dihydrolipoamide acetyltransferase)